MKDTVGDRVRKLVSSMELVEVEEIAVFAQYVAGEKRETARAHLSLELQSRAEAMGFRLDQIIGVLVKPKAPERAKASRAPTSATGKLIVRFRSGEGGTWTGRGRKPSWLVAAEAGGASAEDFRLPG